jgi:hypothetical protein
VTVRLILPPRPAGMIDGIKIGLAIEPVELDLMTIETAIRQSPWGKFTAGYMSESYNFVFLKLYM